MKADKTKRAIAALAAQTYDASRNADLNGVKLPTGERVAWAVAFPKPWHRP